MIRNTVGSNLKVREVVAGLVQARDAQIARVVAMVDGMPDRGEADSLIAPLRTRLAFLRPARPFGLTRLLFSPLDPVIVPGTQWKRGEVGVPRPALAPLGAAVQAAMPAISQSLEDSSRRLRPDDREAITALGAKLWPVAGTLLADLPPPPDWNEVSGFGIEVFADLRVVVGAVLCVAMEIEALAASFGTPSERAIRQVLARAEQSGGLALATVSSILVAWLPCPAKVLTLATEVSADGRDPAADHALDHTLARLRAAVADVSEHNDDATGAAIEAARVATLLSGLEEGPPPSPERRQRMEQIRRDADTLCRRRFDRVVIDTVTKLRAGVREAEGDAGFISLENAARDLRRLESAGRRLGSGEHYDVEVRSVADQFRQDQKGLGLVDRVRMVEILSGPDEAMTLLLAAPA